MALQSGFIKRIRDIMRMDAGINGDAQRIEQMVWMLFLKVYDAKEDDWELSDDNYESIIPEDCRWRNWAKADENGHSMTGDKLLEFVNNTLFPVLKGNDIKDASGNVILKGVVVTPDTPVKKAIVKSTFEDANNYMKDGVYLRQVIDVIDEIEFDDVKESHDFGFVYEEILRELQSAGSSGEFFTPRAVTDFMALMIKPELGEKMADFACGTGGFITSWLTELKKQVKDTEAQKQFDDSIYGVEKKPFPYLLSVTNMLLHDIEVPNIYHQNSLRHNLLDYTDDEKFDVILMNPPYGGHEDKSIQGFFPDDLASSETADLFMSVIMYRLKKNGRAAVVVPDGFLFGLDNAKVAIKTKLLTEYNLHTIVRLPGSVFSPYTSISTNILFFDNTGATTETWYYRVDMPSDRKHFSKTKPMELKHFDECITWWNDRKEIELEDGPKAKKYMADFLLNDQGCNLDLCGYPHEEEEILDPLDTIRNYQEKRAALNAEIDKVLTELEALLPGGIEV
ncbi:MAG: type I restriction-modification system subunit M [Lachnospiraceae bacterium]|nr:type I restriction-modification system subunit M [Lachnospiraceae bacterium]